MKNLFFLVAILLISTNSFAQLTLGTNHMPQAGTGYQSRSADTTGITPGNSGSNQTWNFANLTLQGDVLTTTYVNASSTPFASAFPSANLASTIDNENYSYYSLSGGSLNFYGTGSTAGNMPYQNPAEILKYPLIFNDSYNDNFTSQYDIEGFVTKRTGTVNVVNDGYGTLILPSGSYSAGRIKITQNVTDSMNVGGVSFITNSVITSYQWYSASFRHPLLSMVVSQVTTSFGTTVGKHVDVTTNNQSTGIRTIGQDVPQSFELKQNYPNPFNPATVINYSIPANSDVTLKIYDLTGKEVAVLVNQKQNAGSYAVDFNASNLTSGAYIYRLTAGNFTETKKMILVK